MAKAITIETTINASPAKVWECWVQPTHICQWAFASDDWECPNAANDVRVGGRFSSTMRAKDLSTSFDFSGEYTVVKPMERLEYKMDDERKVQITFSRDGDVTKVVETFEMENTNSEELQRSGWQAILENFRKHVENCK